jgi:hypothetical protein
MSQGRIFADDWRDCLREQFRYVIRQQDQRTEATLIRVMYEAGFNDEELAALRLEATLRADDMPADYVPEEVKAAYPGLDLPLEPDPALGEEVPVTYDELVEQDDDLPEASEQLTDADEDDADDSIQQLSLF